MQEFNIYSDETDPERIQQIIERAVVDVEWIVNQVQLVLIILHINLYSPITLSSYIAAL